MLRSNIMSGTAKLLWLRLSLPQQLSNICIHPNYRACLPSCITALTRTFGWDLSLSTPLCLGVPSRNIATLSLKHFFTSNHSYSCHGKDWTGVSYVSIVFTVSASS